MSGAAAARIAAVYATSTGVTQDEALARLFVPVRDRKNTSARPRGALGRFVRTGDQRELETDDTGRCAGDVAGEE